jgi:hypothetical protein
MAVHIICTGDSASSPRLLSSPRNLLFRVILDSGTVSRLIFPHFVCVGAILKFLEDLCFLAVLE